jgi:D-serine dehydratase
MAVLKLEQEFASLVDGATKALPAGSPPMRLDEIGTRGWNLLAGDVPFPQAILKRGALDRNAGWMRDFLAATGAKLSPHGKTTMAPQLFDLQMSAGAWGITVATTQQFEVARRFGVKRILMANELVDPTSIAAVSKALDADHALEFACIVDSEAGVARLSTVHAAARANRPIRVLVELGIKGKRTGCRTVEEGLAVARAASAAPGVALVGVEGYEGIQIGGDLATDLRIVRKFLDDMAVLAEAIDREGLFDEETVLLTAGGSAYYDLVAFRLSEVKLSRPTETIVRAGCYVTHDSSWYEKIFNRVLSRLPEGFPVNGRLTAALEVWGMVQSAPEPGFAFATFGKRDCSYDTELPTPLQWFRPGLHERPQPIPAGVTVTGLSDQHCHLHLPDGVTLEVGDLVCCGISHPCTTFDRWPVMLVVDDDYNVTGAMRTYF